MKRRGKKVGRYYTLETQDRAERVDNLCEQCGDFRRPIALILAKSKINKKNAKLAVTRCESSVPVLAFRDADGLESEFNTFRLGGAWASRVEKGVRVALTTKSSTIGFAEVVGVDSGTFIEMNDKYGADNHLAISALAQGFEFDLAKVMRECYGGHRFNVGSTVTVIEMRRIE